MTKSQEIRQSNCFNLLRKYKIHDGIVREASDEGVSIITIWHRSSYDLFWHLDREVSVLGITGTKTKQGFKTEICVGIAR